MHLYLLPTLQLHNTLMLEVLKLPQWALIGVDGKKSLANHATPGSSINTYHPDTP